jgi:hypothetical protein
MVRLREHFSLNRINETEMERELGIGKRFDQSFKLLDSIWEDLMEEGNHGYPRVTELGIAKEVDKMRNLITKLKAVKTSIMIKM